MPRRRTSSWPCKASSVIQTSASLTRRPPRTRTSRRRAPIVSLWRLHKSLLKCQPQLVIRQEILLPLTGTSVERTMAVRADLEASLMCLHVSCIVGSCAVAASGLRLMPAAMCAQVMANQADLVEIVHRLHPLLNVKGF